jgi:hypothetical protein
MAAITRVGIAGSSAAYLPFAAKEQSVQVYPVLALTAYAVRVIELDIIALPREDA